MLVIFKPISATPAHATLLISTCLPPLQYCRPPSSQVASAPLTSEGRVVLRHEVAASQPLRNVHFVNGSPPALNRLSHPRSATMATPAKIHTRTRSRWYVESPLRAASPLKHKHPVGGVRHVPKRRRLGVSSLSGNRLPPSSDTDSNRDMYPLRSRFFPSSPRATPRINRRSGALRRLRPSPLVQGDEMSPRKRKRSDDGSNSMSDSESWIETEDEFPDLIAEGE